MTLPILKDKEDIPLMQWNYNAHRRLVTIVMQFFQLGKILGDLLEAS